MDLKKLIITLAGVLVFVGCAKEATTEETTPSEEPLVQEEPAEEPAAPADPAEVHLEGDHIAVDGHINFASDSDEILEDSNALLDKIALFLRNHSTDIAHVRLVGHTDTAGGHEHNQDLSERRAAAVVQALRDRGVTTVLDSSGVGELEPLCEEDTDECHEMNRRVEFIVIVD